MREDGQKTDKLRIKEKRKVFGVPRVPPNLLISWLAEKGGSRTLRGPYDPQTGFEDQRHHRAPSFSSNDFNYLWRATLFCLSIRLSICEVPKALATSAAARGCQISVGLGRVGQLKIVGGCILWRSEK
jgi:hypothetical protein